MDPGHKPQSNHDYKHSSKKLSSNHVLLKTKAKLKKLFKQSYFSKLLLARTIFLIRDKMFFNQKATIIIDLLTKTKPGPFIGPRLPVILSKKQVVSKATRAIYITRAESNHNCTQESIRDIIIARITKRLKAKSKSKKKVQLSTI